MSNNDEEIYGKLARGKKVNIPLNQIIAVKPCILEGISIKSIHNTSDFYCIQNRDEVIKAIAYLLENSLQMIVLLVIVAIVGIIIIAENGEKQF